MKFGTSKPYNPEILFNASTTSLTFKSGLLLSVINAAITAEGSKLYLPSRSSKVPIKSDRPILYLSEMSVNAFITCATFRLSLANVFKLSTISFAFKL